MSSQLGFGVMINMLMGGDRGADKIAAAIGKVIAKLELQDGDPNRLYFEFADGTSFQLWDDGQSCCEHRWMSTDDDLSYYVGAALKDITIEDGPTTGDVHEEQFLRVYTDRGVFTVVTHNEHNGYYGGFYIRVS